MTRSTLLLELTPRVTERGCRLTYPCHRGGHKSHSHLNITFTCCVTNVGDIIWLTNITYHYQSHRYLHTLLTELLFSARLFAHGRNLTHTYELRYRPAYNYWSFILSIMPKTERIIGIVWQSTQLTTHKILACPIPVECFCLQSQNQYHECVIVQIMMVTQEQRKYTCKDDYRYRNVYLL